VIQPRSFGSVLKSPCFASRATQRCIPFLQKNVARLGPGVEIEKSFVGREGATVNLTSAQDLGSNACLVEAADSQGSVKLRSLRTILADHPHFAASKLLKTDTEGFDFDILRQSIDLFNKRSRLFSLSTIPIFGRMIRAQGLQPSMH